MQLHEYTIIAILFASVVFYQLRTAETNTLLAIIIMALFTAASYFYYYHYSRPTPEPTDDTKGRKEAVSTSFAVPKFPKDLKFISYNGALQDIAKDVRFVRIFDKARFADLLVHMDKFQKTYMYMLAGRWRPESYIGTFTDLRAAILEILYSFIHIVPETLKHTYGIQPYEVIQKNIDTFTGLSRKMLYVLQSYSRTNGYIIPDTYFHPFEPSRDHVLP